MDNELSGEHNEGYRAWIMKTVCRWEPKASIAFLGDPVADQSAGGSALWWVEAAGEDALFFDEPADEAARLGSSEAHPALTLQV
jgi:hypothetical protein